MHRALEAECPPRAREPDRSAQLRSRLCPVQAEGAGVGALLVAAACVVQPAVAGFLVEPRAQEQSAYAGLGATGEAIGVGVAALLGFGGTFVILKVIDLLIGIRVSPKVEDAGLDIEEHAERAYADDDELGKI